MAIPSSGPISLDDLQTEFGGTNPIKIDEYYRGGAYVPDNATNSGVPLSGAISLGDFYGAAAGQSRTTTTTWNKTTSWTVYYTTSWGGSYTTSWNTSRTTSWPASRTTAWPASRTTTTTWNTSVSSGPYYIRNSGTPAYFWQAVDLDPLYFPGYSDYANVYWNGSNISGNISFGAGTYTSGGATYTRGLTKHWIAKQAIQLMTIVYLRAIQQVLVVLQLLLGLIVERLLG